MIRILLFLFIILSLPYPCISLGQVDSYVTFLPIIEEGQNRGEVEAKIVSERLEWLDKKSLLEVIKNLLQDSSLKEFDKLPAQIKPKDLPFLISFNPESFVLELTIDLGIKKIEKTNLGIDLSEEMIQALLPAPLGGGINYNLEKSWAHEEMGGNAFNGQFDSFFNIYSLVLESQSYYQKDDDQNKWYRSDTRLVKDLPHHELRTQLGDIYPMAQGFMVPRPLGGINLHRNFTLNPYRLPYPTGSERFSLKSRSFVRYFVNSVLIKSEYLPAGNYSVSDIPLNNGLNTIIIEATDDLGIKQIFTFRTSSSINLLNQGETLFDLSYGVPFSDTGLKREYLDSQGKHFSGFIQYGITRTFSSSLYLQNQQNFNLAGTELIKSTPLGNLSLGRAQSSRGDTTGEASALGYQLITQGQKWFDSHTLSLRYENRSKNLRTSILETASPVQNLYAANYTIPLSHLMTLSIGGNYGDVRDNNLNNRYGVDTNLSMRLFRDHSLSLFLSNNRDEFKQFNKVAYLFLTLTFPETNNYLSAFYDHNQKNSRLTYLRDNQNRLNTIRSQLTAELGEENKTGEIDLLYPTTFSSMGLRINGLSDQEENKAIMKTSVRLSSALVFAVKDNEFAMGIGRLVPGSFVLFSPEESLRGQQISLKSGSPYSEAGTGPFGEIIYSNILAYQYRNIQLDPTMMDEGRSLEKEQFYLYPTYRSAHLIKLTERGSVGISGKLLDAQGNPLGLQVGKINNVTFFTNREGVFFVEGISPGVLKLSLEERDETITIILNKDQRGLYNVGQLQFKDDL